MAWGEWLSVVMVERAEAYSEALVGEALHLRFKSREKGMGEIWGLLTAFGAPPLWLKTRRRVLEHEQTGEVL